MPLERRDVEASLAKKGFVASKGDHRFFTYYTLAGLKTSTWTKTSHGSGYKTLGDGLVNAMAKQCGLTTGQFKDMVGCPLSQNEVEAIFIKNRRINLGK
jgi:predicted RNA binding protein YcfA (HicA-like mRNA interferase family)